MAYENQVIDGKPPIGRAPPTFPLNKGALANIKPSAIFNRKKSKKKKK